MRRRSRAGDEPIKTRRRKAVTVKRRNALKAVRRRRLSAAKLQKQLELRTRELSEALEQQSATAELLRIISSSPGHLQPVFEAMLVNATRICEANFGVLLLYDGTAFHVSATYNAPQAFVEFRQRQPTVRSSGVLKHLVATRRLQHISDCREDASYKQGDTDFVQFVELCSVRTLLAVPMLKENELIGGIGIYRREVRPFADKQIAVITSFANQAVIAIENARLLNELRQRTNELTESLEQQTATSEVLQVISSSPGDLQPVFASMLENAVRICDAKWGTIHRWEGGTVHLMATHNLPSAYANARRRTPYYHPSANSLFGRIAASKSVVHITDAAADKAYRERDPQHMRAVELGGARTVLGVPMLKENELIGALAVARQEVRPFTDKQIELVQNFAAQAVIAIENTRLLSELRESLQQQTATADVLRVISRSTFDPQVVLNTLVESAARLCEADWRPPKASRAPSMNTQRPMGSRPSSTSI